jgi:beta-ribofuranosylaminobenzene 5'-phosphate synthase
MISITTPSRLHLTLIDMNASLGRVDGGIGLSLDRPVIRISAEKSDATEITGISEHVERIRNVVLKLLPAGTGISIKIEEDYPSHIGLGSGTQISLAAAMAVNRIYNLGLDIYELAVRTGRGGTSGIGVAAFENGGFILDGGHRFSEKKDFLPSSASRLPPAPVLLRRDFPDWELLIAVPQQKGASLKKEVSIFQKECPIPLKEVEQLSHIILMQMLPSLIEEDIVTFGRSINAVQEVGFKRREVALQPVSGQLMDALREGGAYGAGMSSFGPTVYAFGEDIDNLRRIANEFLDGRGQVFITKARNKGAKIIIN